MPTLHLFNPGHDEALAFTKACTTGSRAARLLENELALLPIWWAGEGDFILLPVGTDLLPEGTSRVAMGREGTEDGGNMCRYRVEKEGGDVDHDTFSLTVFFPGVAVSTAYYTLVLPKKGRTLPAAFWDKMERVEVWGWDLSVRLLLYRLGAPERLLPAVEWVNGVVRPLSSRETAVSLLPLLRRELPGTAGRSCWCRTLEDVGTAVREYGDALCKVAWSCSGRGVFPVSSPWSEGTAMRIGKSLNRCGGIAVEPFYDRVSDLAMEFVSTGTEVRFEGMSVFVTSGAGRYGGNIVASDERLSAGLPQVIQAQLPLVREVLTRHLALLLAGRYAGPLGVDMMVVRLPDGQVALHPCVEINLRRTMGFVALHLRRLLSGGGDSLLFGIRPTESVSPEMCRLTPCSRQMSAVLEGIRS